MKKYYTIGELHKMGISINTLKQKFYKDDPKKWGITIGKVWRMEKVVSEESFQKYFKHLIKSDRKKQL